MRVGIEWLAFFASARGLVKPAGAFARVHRVNMAKANFYPRMTQMGADKESKTHFGRLMPSPAKGEFPSA
jgi:hypothetical protein